MTFMLVSANIIHIIFPYIHKQRRRVCLQGNPFNSQRITLQICIFLDVDGYEDIDGGNLLRELTPYVHSFFFVDFHLREQIQILLQIQIR